MGQSNGMQGARDVAPFFVVGSFGPWSTETQRKSLRMNAFFTIAAAVGPQLYAYFTKNKGLNTVSGAAGGSLLTLVVLGMQTAGYDQLITFLQNYGESGLIAAAVMAGLRVAVQVYKASKPIK